MVFIISKLNGCKSLVEIISQEGQSKDDLSHQKQWSDSNSSENTADELSNTNKSDTANAGTDVVPYADLFSYGGQIFGINANVWPSSENHGANIRQFPWLLSLNKMQLLKRICALTSLR